MSYHSRQLHKPGERVAFRSIFEEMDEHGDRTNRYIACATGDRLPETETEGHFWIERSIYDLHAGIS